MVKRNIIVLWMVLVAFSCNQATKVEPKQMENSNIKTSASTGIFSNSESPEKDAAIMDIGDGSHTVKVIQVLPTDKYVYMEVEEDGNSFWVAASKQEVEVGQEYFFKDGLLKTNFHSKEYDRVFDKVY